MVIKGLGRGGEIAGFNNPETYGGLQGQIDLCVEVDHREWMLRPH